MFYRRKQKNNMLHDKNYNFYCIKVYLKTKGLFCHTMSRDRYTRCCILFATNCSNAGGIANKMRKFSQTIV